MPGIITAQKPFLSEGRLVRHGGWPFPFFSIVGAREVVLGPMPV